MFLIEALTEEQITIISRNLDENYPMKNCIEDIFLIADITELKIRLKGSIREVKK